MLVITDDHDCPTSPAAAGAAPQARLRQRGSACSAGSRRQRAGPGGRACGRRPLAPAAGSPRVRKQRNFTANEGFTRTRCCSSCWIGTGMTRNRAIWNGFDEICRNMQENANMSKYVPQICENMQMICKYRSEFIPKFANIYINIDSICTSTNMHKICRTMHQKYHQCKISKKYVKI